MLIRSGIVGALLGVAAQAATNQAIVVSAPRLDDLDLMAVDTAADVTVIDRQTIEQSGAKSVPDLLQHEANVLIRSTTGNGFDGQISMRGYGENSHLRTLVTLDGHTMNRPDMGGVGWMEIPVDNIERIEVIRGGQNVLYGNHALGGVVKITSKRGADAGLKAGVTLGSFGYQMGSAGSGAAVGNVDLYAGVQGFSSDGYRTNSAARAVSAFGSVAWYINNLDTLTFRVSFTDSESEFPGPLGYEEMQQDPTQSSSDDLAEAASGHVSAIWEAEREWGGMRLTGGAKFQDRNWVTGGTYGDNQLAGYSLGPRIRWGDSDVFIMSGIDIRYDQVKHANLHPDNTDYALSDAELSRLTLAPYLFGQRELSRRFSVNGGLRYEHAQTDNDYDDYVDEQILPFRNTNRGPVSNPNYKNPPDIDPLLSYDGVIKKQGWAAETSLMYEPNKLWSAWLSYDHGYHYPSLDESASYQGYPLTDPLNEALEPEISDTVELGGRFQNRNWLCSLNTFIRFMEDEIVFVSETVGGITMQSNENIGSTRRVGAEVEVAYTERWYGASTRWSVVDARMNGGEYDGNSVPLVPWANGTVSGWLKPAEFLRLAAVWSFVAQQYQGGDQENGERKMDAYGLLGFRVYVDLTDHAGLHILMDNVLDETYASSAYYGGFYPGAGRSFRVGMNWEF
ncbi:TonB-dependent receptor [Pontiellaceae bacterium B12227]|nr:TonB-dependent receptor [Pontiellaceae bacterium B12227]